MNNTKAAATTTTTIIPSSQKRTRRDKFYQKIEIRIKTNRYRFVERTSNRRNLRFKSLINQGHEQLNGRSKQGKKNVH